MIMKFLLTILLLFTTVLFGKVINIDDKTKIYDVLPSAQIYIDKTRKLTIDDITTKDIQFEDNAKSLLGYGYSPDFDVWVKFTLKNDTNKPIQKVLEYGNSMTTDVVLYDLKNNVKIQDGLLNMSSSRNSINPIFNIKLDSNETKIYYVKVSSYITTMIIKLKLLERNDFYTQELKHQVILALFFGAMLILAIYNLFIYFFTKDISYLFYVFYILSISVHHTLYVGIANLYILDNIAMNYVVQFAAVFIALPIFFLALFSKSFLQIKKYFILNKILNILLIIFPFSLIVFTLSDGFNHYRNTFTMIVLLYLIVITIYLSYKRNRQAHFILFGWLILLFGSLAMYLSGTGIINLYQSFPYIVEVSLLSEAILFSIALSDKINTLQTKLIVQKRTENERLEIQVLEKTKDLNISLEEKTLLLQELNHRVKNNMQMIISLIRLQTNDIDDKKIQNLFLTTQNRLNAMSQLHELLYQKDDISYINAYEYFTTLIEGLQETYSQNININYTISTDLETEQAISCGIILNELVTNSFKYAFHENSDDATIDISLIKENGQYILIVKDNGVGYDQKTVPKSFGLILVATLVESKLQGTITADTKNGANIKIVWSEEDE